MQNLCAIRFALHAKVLPRCLKYYSLFEAKLHCETADNDFCRGNAKESLMHSIRLFPPTNYGRKATQRDVTIGPGWLKASRRRILL